MLPASPAAPITQDFGHRRGFLSRKTEWLFSPELFRLKLLLGASIGVLVLLVVAVSCLLFAFRGQRRDQLRAHTIEVMTLSSVIENDLAALENAYRGHLLTRDNVYLEESARIQSLFLQHSNELSNVVAPHPQQRKGILKMREIVQNFLTKNVLFVQSQEGKSDPRRAFDAMPMEEARKLLQTTQREEQIEFNQQAREQERAAQSTQVLAFLSKMERAASEMQTAKRGYLLTGDPAFIDSCKRATADFYTCQGYLAVLVANEPDELKQLDRIREHLDAWIAQSATPYIEAKRSGQDVSSLPRANRSEVLMNNVRQGLEQFKKEQADLYKARSSTAGRARILTATAISLFCAFAAVLMLLSSSYSFVLCRRQLQKLRSADTRIRLVIDNILDGMVTLDETGAVYAMNPAAKEMFGYRKWEFFTGHFTQLVSEYFERNTQTSATTYDWNYLVGSTGRTILALARTRERATFPVEISLSETVVDERKYYIAMIRDITEQKRFEEELAAEKKSLAVTLSSIGEGVITTDVNGRIVVCNAASETLTGWPTKEAVGRPLKAVFQISAEAGRKNDTPNTGYRSEAEAILFTTAERSTLTARNGTQRIVEQVASPIRDGRNELCGVVLVFRDITEKQRDEAERRKAETLEQLGLLAGGIAHDFNNLLTAIIGNISLAALLLPPNDDMADRLDDAKNASLRARDLAQQLLTFARGGAPIKKAASIASLIEETVSFSLRGSHSRSVLNLAPDLWSAEFDPGQISQVIANLVVNAEQAMPDGGTLHVDCDNFSSTSETTPAVPDLLPGDYIRIRVRDEGVGIPERFLKQIFDPYFTTKPKGSGLGLATTYSIVKNHGGFITAESEQHCGSTFTVYLSAARVETVPLEPVRTSPEPIQGSGRILIVDDEEAIRALVEFTLCRFGYEVTGAETALQGIELYREALVCGQRFDLVILDLTLPGGMGGKEALRKLIEIDPMVTAIVSSGYAMDATMSRYEDFGFRGVIAKPYEASELGCTVRDVIAANRLGCEAACELQGVC
jgi:two-component system, cell cycle sensor histidine kinase and response regulator CckA